MKPTVTRNSRAIDFAGTPVESDLCEWLAAIATQLVLRRSAVWRRVGSLRFRLGSDHNGWILCVCLDNPLRLGAI